MVTEIGKYGYYLVIINVIGFILVAINKGIGRKAEKLIPVVSLFGGSAGVLLSILLFDRKSVKENMMSRVFSVCVLIIQIVLFLLLNKINGETVNFSFIEFFSNHKIFSVYLAIINVVTFVTFGIDKLLAIKKRFRISIVTLLGLCFVGGSVGGLIAMYLFRHKTNGAKNNFFTVGVPLMIVMQSVVVFYLMNI